jgi:PBSX family phage terminase large subunit
MTEWHPFPKQELALKQSTDVFEILFGGSRGPGKTDAGLAWLLYDITHPMFRALVIRRNSDDLSDWIDRAGSMYRRYGVKIAYRPAVLTFPSGAVIKTGHLKDDNAYGKYQGHEYHRMLIEELTQIPSERRYLQLIASCRSTVRGLPAQVFATTNPGGQGHSWVKNRFVEPSPPGVVFKDATSGRKRVFIQSTVDDNPLLNEVDPNYILFLDSLKDTDEQLYKAWRLGSWDVWAGQAFREFIYDRHVINTLPVPIEDMTNIISLDWGFNHHGAAYWQGVCPEDELGIKRIITYRELYQNQKTPREWAEDILDLSDEEVIDYIVLPHDAFAHKDGNRSIAEVFEEVFKDKIHIVMGGTMSQGANINRVAISHELLSIAPDGKPYTQIHQNCRALIRTLPNLIYDEKKPEVVDKSGNHEDDNNDDPFDAWSLGLLTITDGKSWLVTPNAPKDISRQTPYYGNEDGTTSGEGLDIGKILEDANSPGRDWRNS